MVTDAHADGQCPDYRVPTLHAPATSGPVILSEAKNLKPSNDWDSSLHEE